MTCFLDILSVRARRIAQPLAAVAVVLSLSACHNRGEEEPTSPVVPNQHGSTTEYQSVVEMGSYIVQPSDLLAAAGKGPQRVHLGKDNTTIPGGVTDILWSEGDEVICWSSSEKLFAPYILTSGAGTTNARFQGKAVDEGDNVQGQLAVKIDCAIYPASAVAPFLSNGYNLGSEFTFPGNLVTNTFFVCPGEQTYHAPIDGNPTFDPALNIMTGRGNGKGTTFFQSVGGILLLRIKGSSLLNSLYKMKLTSKKEEKLWGTFSAAIGPTGGATVSVATDINGKSLPSGYEGSKSLILDCSAAFGGENMLPKDAFTNFYFVVPYGVFQEGFTITMDTDGDGLFDDGTITTSKDNTIHQSQMKVMPALELTENVTLTWDLDDLYNQGTITEF